MTDVKDTSTSKQITESALIGFSILFLFAAGFALFYYYVGVLGYGGLDVFVAFMPFCLFPYSLVISIYVGLFTAKFAKDRRQHSWLWGIGGFSLTILFIFGAPILSSVFPYQSPVIFLFLAPVVSTLLVMLLISIRRKAIL